MRSTVTGQQAALLGTGTCGNKALHAELRGIFRQAYNVSLPSFRLKLDLFKLSKQVAFDGARRIPTLGQMNQGRVAEGDVFSRHGPRMQSQVPLPEVKSWRGSWGASPLSESGWAQHCSEAVVSGRVSKAVGEFTTRRGSVWQKEYRGEARLKQAYRVHDAPAVTYERRWGHLGSAHSG